MKLPIHAALAVLAASCLPTIALSETAVEIAKKHDLEKIAALTSYLEANPKVDDRDMALNILVSSNMAIGEFTPVPDLLTQRYDIQNKGPDANLQMIVAQIVRPFIEASIVSNQRDKAKEFVTKVKGDLAAHPQSAQVNQFIDQLASDLYLPGVGDTMEFAFTDLEGNEVDLAKMKDKVILIDFWATWCGPCVAEMPNVIETYNKHNEAGFDVIGVSLDEDKAALKQFIERNKMPWPQYFDGKGWANEIAQRFGIGSIPATFLIGKDRKVVASNLRGEALEEAVTEALGKE